MPLTFDLSVSIKGTSNFVRNIFRHSTNIDDQLVKISTWDHGGILGYSQRSEEVVHASLSVIAMSRVQQNLLFSSTYLQPIFNLLGVVMEHFKSLLLAFGRVCDAF